jgi:hypothetical protein
MNLAKYLEYTDDSEMFRKSFREQALLRYRPSGFGEIANLENIQETKPSGGEYEHQAQTYEWN